MFQKNTFAPSTSFGGFNAGGATTSPFGFKPAGAASAFGAAPAFGASAAPQQPAGGGLFGASTNTGGLFGANTSAATPAPAFGSPATGGFGFGQTSAGGGMFGAGGGAGGGQLFGGQTATTASAFGAKPTGFGFNNASTAGTGAGLFGASGAGGGLFGQQSAGMGGGGLFSSPAGGFGQQQNAGTAVAKFSPVIGTDSVIKSGQTTTITIKHHCITCMKEYESKSLEELRLEDYTAGRRGAAGAGVFGGAGSAFQPPGDPKPAGGGLFGQPIGFGQPATTSGGSMFGAGALNTSFGQPSAGFSFGGGAQTNTSTSLFGAPKPTFGATSTAGGGLFGSSAQPAPAFGASTSSFGFGSTATQPQTTGLFGAKPGTGFGAAAAPAASGFGGFNTGAGGLFGSKLTTSAAPAFGAAAPAFGSLAGGGFGTNTSAAGGLFGTSALGAKPAAPAFGFGAAQPQPTLGGGGLGTLGGNTFNQPKLGGTGFPTFSSGATFALPTQTTAQPLGGFGTTQLGGGLGGFGSLGAGALGGSALGGLGGFGNAVAMQPGGVSGATNAGNVHEQILSLAARPYGVSPLFKELAASSVTSADVLKPTNPSAVKAVLDKSNYRVSPPDAERLRVQPLAPAAGRNKKSLFDGLEESDASLEERLSLKPSRKRLVLRPQQNRPHADVAHRTSPEDASGADSSYVSEGAGAGAGAGAGVERRRVSFEEEVRGVNTDLEEDSESRANWLGSRLSPGSPKSRPTELNVGPSQRIYPDLEKELPASDRRASWLTTKPLRKPQEAPDGAAAAESSVRELRPAPAPRPHLLRDDKENIQTSTAVSEEERPSATEAPPHPAGVKLTRSGYYTVPSLQDMIGYVRADGSCVLPSLTIGRYSYGSIHYDTQIDVAGLDLDKLVHLKNKEVCVYEDESEKPPVGEGLNRRAVVTLERVWPRDKSAHRLITDPDKLLKMDYEGKLRRVCEKHDTKFVEYRPETGSWVFKVEHFSKYGLTDSDEEEDTPDIIRRQLSAQTAAATATSAAKLLPPIGTTASVITLAGTPLGLARPASGIATSPIGLGGLSHGGSPLPVQGTHPLGGGPPFGGGSPPNGGPPLAGALPLGEGLPLGGGASLGRPSRGGASLGLGAFRAEVPTRSVSLAGHLSMHDESMDGVPAVTSLHSFGGTSKGLAMDTSEENSMESQSLYTDTAAVFGVKSPTSELARLDHRSSHRVQLMKASLYSDTILHDMEENASVSTGDQLVPQPGSPASVSAAESLAADAAAAAGAPPLQLLPATQEVAMRPLVVKPHTVVLRYHRRVPPFAQTIAGRLGAACIADMAVCRARHCRVGFAPGGRLALVTTQQRLAELPLQSPLSCLEEYVSGRGADDWSAPAVARLAVAGRDAALAPGHFQEAMEPHLLALLEHSESEPPADAECSECPRLLLKADPASRLALLQKHMRQQPPAGREKQAAQSWQYWSSVWSLCSALWGGELASGGARRGGDADGLARQRALAAWLERVAERSEPTSPVPADSEDESDAHSSRVLALMLGGKVMEACRVAREHNDLNMAALLAQACGDACVRQLLGRQLDAWRECGALALVSRPRALALTLAAGRRELGGEDVCARLHWLTAFNVHHRYLCRQVASVEEVVRSYEASFCRARDPEREGEGCDLGALTDEQSGLEYPMPDYCDNYELSIESGGVTRRVLDLRYELLRARAYDTRPNVQPAAHTSDPLDYSLSFLLGAWLGNVSVAAVTGFAEQLEAAGAWHLAVLALMYHPARVPRCALVRAMVSRHAPARADSREAEARLAFLRRLRVPERWVLLARAHRAKYEGLWGVEAEHLVGAGEWNAAHRVLLDKLLPDAVLADELEKLSPLLDRLNAAAESERVSGWECGGRALYHYLHVYSEIRGLFSDGGSEEETRSLLPARMEALRPRVATACRALGALAAPSARHAAARTEMGARLLQLAVCAGASSHQLTALLHTLKLPPDCRRAVMHKITTELAEQASESCAASAETSPVSSHVRAVAPLTTANN